MSNRRRPTTGRRNRLIPRPMSDMALNRMARSSCDRCGADVDWVDADRARAHGVDLDEAAAFFRLPHVNGLDIWICARCDNGGVMGPPEYGSL